ncbi:hypothetical protein [Flavobacterium sp. HJJ]|uniref:hypothetical protein n=1 Tax=Flavobacterium sp. HJJ TaxID=2783792 RepID=UPI00188DC22D|nr:hypothetical protein [Flavobacterium sp. HJJ]MBF4473799.1 hypothetical protein [Flavobacterium sp. HJJ]
MIEYIFQSNSNSATKKIAEHIKEFTPKINFVLEDGYFGLAINCNFESQNDKDSFIQTLVNSLNISEDGSYLS